MSEAPEDSVTCSNWCALHSNKSIARSAYSLHEVHCQRNFQKCTCGEVIKKTEREAHIKEKHAPVTCEQCRQTFEAFLQAAHKCPKPLRACEFCEAQISFDDFAEHTQQCGNRTQQCQLCKGFIPLRDYDLHVAAGNCLPPLPSYPSVPRRPEPSAVWPPVAEARSTGVMGSGYYPQPYGSGPVTVPTVVSQPYSSRSQPQPSFYTGPNVSGPYRISE